MKLKNSKWKDNIYDLKRRLGGFIVYNFMKSWDDVRLPQINNVCIYVL
jgi:hypothetical protein